MKQGTKAALQAGGTIASVAVFVVTYLAIRGSDGAATAGIGQPVTEISQTQSQPSQLQPVRQRAVPRPVVQTRTRAS